MSRALKAAAMPFADVTPSARIASIVAITSFALLSASALRASTARGW